MNKLASLVLATLVITPVAELTEITYPVGIAPVAPAGPVAPVAPAGPVAPVAYGDAEDHGHGARGGGRRRSAAGDPVRPKPVRRADILPLCGDPAGHAHRLHRAADLHLRAGPDRARSDLRVDRGVLPDPVEHYAGAEIDRP